MNARALRTWEWPLAALVAAVALLVLGLAPLATPYWWDAAAVYVPGARWIAAHHFAAVPGVFPSVLGRGHTTLYYVVLAAAFRLAGTAAPVVGHALALAFAVAAVTLTYALGTWLYSRAAGVAAGALLVASPLFLTMSFEALPEVPIAALTAATLYAFARGRNGSAALFATLLVLTKETGVACPLAVVGASLVFALRGGDRARTRRVVAWMTVPLATLAGFFVWQRVAEGWWVLPYHAQLFDAVHDLRGQAVRVTRSVFVSQGHGVVCVAALLAALVRSRRGPPYAHDPATLDDAAPPRAVVLGAIALVLAANLAFFTRMFFLERYALAVQPGLSVVLAGALVPAQFDRTTRVPTAWAAAALVAGCAIGVRDRDAGHDYASGETTFRYLHAVRTHVAIARILDARESPPEVLTTWPLTDELAEPALGWVRRPYAINSIEGYEGRGHRSRTGHPIDAVLAAPGLGAYTALTDEARRLGMHVTHAAHDGGASLELWER